MEALSILARVIATIVLPQVLESSGEAIGEKLGEATIKKSSDVIQLFRKTVHDKLQSVGTVGLLKRAEEKPTEQNVHVLEGELVNQMEEDRGFTEQLQVLIQQIQAQSPSLQVVLDGVRVKGSAEIGAIEQIREGGSGEQVVARNVGVGGDFKLGNVTQRIGD